MELILGYVELANEVRDILRPSLAVSKINELGMYSVLPQTKAIDFHESIILANKYVKGLSLSAMRIESVDQIEPITRAIKAREESGHYFDSLNLSGCILTGGDWKS